MLAMIGRLIRRLIRLGLLVALGYGVYRLIAEPVRTFPTSGDGPRSGTGGGAPDGKASVGAPSARPRAGTKPAGADRPASGPSQPAPSPKPGTVRSIGVGEVPTHIPKWVEPADDGTPPPTHPVKAKLASGIFHVPGGQFYDRVRPDRCYKDAAAAEADGLRPSKS